MRGGGRFRWEVTLRRVTTTKSAMGTPVAAWNDFVKVRADRQDVSDGERSQAAETAAVITTRFQIRWRPELEDLDATWQLRFDGRLYDIKAVKQPVWHREVEISATARAEAPDRDTSGTAPPEAPAGGQLDFSDPANSALLV